mmetsp:Transcript_18061/g.36389  ORF Transcript_18061/g.36389 Transcript_18061/m.36389 type:complete len:207 (+) Transcript_18061:374-994(+)
MTRRAPSSTSAFDHLGAAEAEVASWLDTGGSRRVMGSGSSSPSARAMYSLLKSWFIRSTRRRSVRLWRTLRRSVSLPTPSPRESKQSSIVSAAKLSLYSLSSKPPSLATLAAALRPLRAPKPLGIPCVAVRAEGRSMTGRSCKSQSRLNSSWRSSLPSSGLNSAETSAAAEESTEERPEPWCVRPGTMSLGMGGGAMSSPASVEDA